MRHLVRRIIVPALFLAVAVGCGSSGGQKPESYSAIGGTMKKVLDADFDSVYKATLGAMQALELKPMVTERDGFRVVILGETVMGQVSQTQEVRVWINRVSENSTKVELRIVGRRDEDRLKAILDGIEKRLEKPKKS